MRHPITEELEKSCNRNSEDGNKPGSFKTTNTSEMCETIQLLRMNLEWRTFKKTESESAFIVNR